MDYNKELEKLNNNIRELIENAKKEGYKYVNGELIKDKYTPVIEFYGRYETIYESSGYYTICRKIIPITEEIFNKFKKLDYKNKELIVNELTQTDEMQEILKNEDTLFEIIEPLDYLNEAKLDIINSETMDEFYYIGEENCALEINFSDRYGNGNINGYFSIFKMNNDDIEKYNEIDVNFSKVLISN